MLELAHLQLWSRTGRGNVLSVGVLQLRKYLQSRKTGVGGEEEALFKSIAKSGAWVINN